MIINCNNLKTLSLKNFKKLENGRIVIKSESLCLHDSIVWSAISSNKVEFIYKLNSSCGTAF